VTSEDVTLSCSRGYWRDASESPTGTGYHYNHNAETYLLVGDALGRTMVDMLEDEPESPPPPAPPGAMAASATPPPVDGEDIANYAVDIGTDKWWPGTSAGTSSAKGQTFTTGNGAVRFRGVTYRISSTQKAEPTKTYVVRVGTVHGSTFTEVHSETFTQDFTWNSGEYMTWAFRDAPLLLGNTTYAVDVGLTGSTSVWETGIPYITFTANDYPGGSFYTSGLSGVGDSTLNLNGARDRTFHLDMVRPISNEFEFVVGNPTNGTANALVPFELVATFSQDLVAGSGNITIRNLSDATDTDVPVGDSRVSVSDNLLLIETAGLIEWGKNYAIRVDAGAIENVSGTGFAGITNDTTWSFTTAGADPLLAAVSLLKAHINGVTNLSAGQIEAQKLTIDDERGRLDASAANVSAVLDLVTTYDGTEGPIWVSGSTVAGGFNRNNTNPAQVGSVSDQNLHWVIYSVMQYIMDEVYGKPGSLEAYRSLLDGYSFGSHVDFPGAVASSVVAGETNSVSINASFPQTFGRDTQQWTLPARKPTGCYLPPGEIGTVIVPPALVGKGYKVRVGAHSWDLGHRHPVGRLERCTVLHDIDSTEIQIGNPLGGGIYIEVPMGISNGVVTVQVTGAVRSPYFSYKSFHTTTSNEWVTGERNLGAPWADFQSDKYMMQVPSKWIYNLPDPETLMQQWDATMDVQNDLMGFPRLRGKETMYCQVDVILRSSVHAPGYPAVNQQDGTPTDEVSPPGYAGSYLVRGPQHYASIPETEIHEQGHAYFFPKFGGETEVEVNLPYVAVLNRAFGYDLSFSLAASRGYEGNPHRTLDNTAVTWMTVFNFSPREVPMASGEKAYQLKGHAKFVDIARLFGWDGLGDFWYYYNSNDTYNISYPTDDDSKLVQLCKSVGHDIRPLFHFWGTPPNDPVAVQAAIDAEGLTAPTEIRDLLLYYKSLVPPDNSAFTNFVYNWWGKQPSINGYWTEREHSRQWDEEALFSEGDQQRADITTNEMYSAACATQVTERVQEIIDIYYSSDTDWHVLPFSEPFEARTLGGLDGQHGWSTEAAEVQTNVTFGGSAKAGSVTAAGGYLLHTFSDARTRVWTDMRLQVKHSPETPEPAADATVVIYVSTNSQVMAFDGNNTVDTGLTAAEDEWVRFTILSDYTAGTWLLYVQSVQAGPFDFHDPTATGYRGLAVKGDSSFVDDIVATDDDLSTLYASGGTITPVPWVLSYGGDPNLVNEDGDALTLDQECLIETDPTVSNAFEIIAIGLTPTNTPYLWYNANGLPNGQLSVSNSTDLASGTWSELPGRLSIPGGNVVQWTGSAPAGTDDVMRLHVTE